jgi:hypothetical protein
MNTELCFFDLDTVDRKSWDSFLLKNCRYPYSHSTTHARYVFGAYNRKPQFLIVKNEFSELRCLIFFDEASRTVSWGFGPFFRGELSHLDDLGRRFWLFIEATRCRVRNSLTLPMEDIETSAFNNSFISSALSLKLANISICGTYVITLDEDIWLRASYRSGGKRRSVLSIFKKCERNGMELIDSCSELVNKKESFETLVGYYKDLIEESQSRLEVRNQSAISAAKVLISQDLDKESNSFFAILNGVPVAAVNLGIVGREAYVRKLVYSDVLRVEKLGGTYFIIMKCLEWAQQQGIEFVHLPLVRLGLDEKERNITRFKKRFGGIFLPSIELKG